MKASDLIKQLTNLVEKFGDLEIAVETPSEILETTDLLEWDTFEPGHPGYYLIQTDDEL